MSPYRVLLPVVESQTFRRTVAEMVDRTESVEDTIEYTVVYLPDLRTGLPVGEADIEHANQLLDRVSAWIHADTSSDVTVTVTTKIVGTNDNLYSPLDIAELLLGEVTTRGIDLVVFDPSYDPGGKRDILDPVQQLIHEESDAITFEPSVRRVTRRPRFPTQSDIRRSMLIFGLTFAFYLILAGAIDAYELITGVLTASIVTLVLGAVALWQPPAMRYTPGRALRACVYIPYLLLMIISANISLARVILHPNMDLEPRVVRYHPAVFGPFPLTTLANSITLTPGTLSMRVVDQELLVHTLTASAREDLLTGRLERAVRFLFFGRRAMRVASPVERGDAEVLRPVEDDR